MKVEICVEDGTNSMAGFAGFCRSWVCRKKIRVDLTVVDLSWVGRAYHRPNTVSYVRMYLSGLDPQWIRAESQRTSQRSGGFCMWINMPSCGF